MTILCCTGVGIVCTSSVFVHAREDASASIVTVAWLRFHLRKNGECCRLLSFWGGSSILCEVTRSSFFHRVYLIPLLLFCVWQLAVYPAGIDARYERHRDAYPDDGEDEEQYGGMYDLVWFRFSFRASHASKIHMAVCSGLV